MGDQKQRKRRLRTPPTPMACASSDPSDYSITGIFLDFFAYFPDYFLIS